MSLYNTGKSGLLSGIIKSLQTQAAQLNMQNRLRGRSKELFQRDIGRAN